MKHYILTDNLEAYRNVEYTGYFWMSDSPSPVLVDGKFTLPEAGGNPFVIESNLYAKDGSVSISIEHVDGKYIIGIVKWQDTNDIVLEEQTYLAHRLENIKKVKFVRAWIPVADIECAGMEVLQPAWRAFVGFDTLNVENQKIL